MTAATTNNGKPMVSDTSTERQVRTEEQVKGLQSHIHECMTSFRPDVLERLRLVELKIAYGIGGLAVFQFVLSIGLAIYLKK